MDSMPSIHSANIYPLMFLGSLVAIASLRTSITLSLPPSILACVLAIGVILSSRVSKRNQRAPPYAPVTFFEAVSKLAGNDFPWFVSRLSQTVGPIFRLRIAPFMDITVVNDASVVKAILNDPSSFKPRKLYNRVDRMIDGEKVPYITTKEGSVWKDTRKPVAHAFAPQHVKRMKSVCYEQLEQWIRINIDSKPGKSFDVFQEMSRLTLQIICKATFEYDMTDSEVDMFITENNLYLDEVAGKQRMHPWRKWCKSVLPSVRRAYQASENTAVFARRVLASYREKVNAGIESSEDTVIKLLENSGVFKTEAEKIAEITGLISAGYHTTAHSLAWTLLELAKNPKVVENARDEMKGMSNILGIANADCIQHIVREGLRMYPVLPHVFREVSRDIHTKSTGTGMSTNKSSPDFIIPKGSIIGIQLFSLLRSPEYYSDPDTFNPSRWTNPSKVALDAFIPFIVGRRNCVGQRLAYAELHTVIAKMIMEYNLEVEVEGSIFVGMTMQQKGTRLIARKNMD